MLIFTAYDPMKALRDSWALCPDLDQILPTHYADALGDSTNAIGSMRWLVARRFAPTLIYPCRFLDFSAAHTD